MRPAAETLARIAVDERHRIAPQQYAPWDELTPEQRRTELAVAHRQAEVFGLFGLTVRVSGDAVIMGRTIQRETPDPIHPIQRNMARAEADALKELAP